MNTLAVLTEARDAAQNELTQAEVALLEATVRAEEAREAARRLEAAVAALNGETSAPTSALRADVGPPDNGGESAEGRQAGSRPAPAPNPYGHLKCTGCGTQGNMLPGAHGMMVCQTCGNMLG